MANHAIARANCPNPAAPSEEDLIKSYNYVLTSVEFRNVCKQLDYEVLHEAKSGMSREDQLELITDPVKMNAFFDKYNQLAAQMGKPQMFFDKVTMRSEENEWEQYYSPDRDLLKPELRDPCYIGDVVNYQNYIREVIADGEPKTQEDFESAKNEIMKNTALIIATRAVWPKNSKQTLAEIRKDLFTNKTPEFREKYRKDYDQKMENCQQLAEEIYEKRADFKKMFDSAKDWKSLVELSKNALTPTALNITFKMAEVNKEMQKQNQLQNIGNLHVKEKVIENDQKGMKK
jgi:hypothetical protein